MNIKSELIKRLYFFHPDIPIYGEEIEQGFEVPCFYVKRVSGNPKRMNKFIYNKRNTFDVHYFAESNELAELMSEKLFLELEYLNDFLVRGTKMSYTIEDKVLHFLVSYNYNLRVIENEEYMKQLTVKGKVNNNGSN